MEREKKTIWGYLIRKGRRGRDNILENKRFKKYASHPEWGLYVIQEGEPEGWGYRKISEGKYELYSYRFLKINPDRKFNKEGEQCCRDNSKIKGDDEMDKNITSNPDEIRKYCEFLKSLPVNLKLWSRVQPSKTRSGRKRFLKKYGKYAFLDPENLKYPIITKKGEFSPYGLLAAYKRARQYGDDEIAEKAIKIGKCMNLLWAQANPSEIQSILFDRNIWTLKEARRWLKEHDFQYRIYERTKNYYRFPQLPVENFERFRIKDFGKGIKAVIGFEEDLESNSLTNPDKEAYNKYMELYKEYLCEARRLYKEGNLPQSGEKYYGAVAELLKMIGEKRGWDHKGHVLRREIIRKLNNEYPELNLWNLYINVEILHQNFYENDLTKEMFDECKGATETLISHLEKILEKL